MAKSVTVMETIAAGYKSVERVWTDEEIRDLFPVGDGSLVDPLLTRAQEAEAKIERLTRELSEKTGELGRLTRGIQELDDIHRHERAYADLDPHDGRWYVYERDGQCNDGRHADSLLELVRKLGASTDDIGQAPDNT